MPDKSIPPLLAVKRRLGRWLVRARLLKPLLPYVESHLVDHCNLNCRGCSHYSPLAEPWYADPGRHARDMWQLRRHFRQITHIRLMGGEPLLHPGVEQFLASTRRAWPTTAIHLVTNGILLRRMPPSFWQTCRDNKIIIDWTIYPPMADQCDSLCDFVVGKGAGIQAHKAATFLRSVNFDGDSDPVQAFRSCRSRYFCPFLRQGRLYLCWHSALAHHLNRALGTQIPSDGFADIHAPGMTGHRILEILHRPARTCGYCCPEPREYAWGRSMADRCEWDGRIIEALEPVA